MRKIIGICSILLSLTCCFVFSEEKIKPSVASGFFITDNGILVTNYHDVGNAKNIYTLVRNREVELEIFLVDRVNDIAILKPKYKVRVCAVPIYVGPMQKNMNIKCISATAKDQEMYDCKITSLEGVKGDISNYKIEFVNSSKLPKNGMIFNEKGYCVGFISSPLSDVYAFVQTEDIGKNTFVKKSEYLFPLLKEINGIYWISENEEIKSIEIPSVPKDSVVPVFFDADPSTRKAEEVASEDYDKIRSLIPVNALFISASISSGYNNSGFVDILLEELDKNNVGPYLNPTLKQKFYKSIYDKFGGSSLSAEEVVKIAADLANGYFIQVNCNIVVGDAEDSVYIKLYQKHSIDIIVEVNQEKVINADPEKVVKDLTVTAVKEFVRKVKDRVPDLIYQK
ncbi:MAG: hypothetical protein ACD_79C00718G0005 [uncultured bacterium]|nr:MAG: hypothetical protein ACD_79C00718G0005 [uncultured bacterium]